MIVVMGVSGCGKSTVGSAVARELGLSFVEADELHGPHNIEKMRSGRPLTDEDRAPWLAAVGRTLMDRRRYPDGLLITCSALRRAYRDQLRQAAPGVLFVFLDVPQAVAEQRLQGRPHHFMPVSLVPSQFETLERPGRAETDVVRIGADGPVDAVVKATVHALCKGSGPGEAPS